MISCSHLPYDCLMSAYIWHRYILVIHSKHVLRAMSYCMHDTLQTSFFACISYSMHAFLHACHIASQLFLKSSLLKTKCLYVFVLCFVNIYISANLWHAWPSISWHTSSWIHLGTHIPTEGPNCHISSTLLITHDYFLLCLHLYDIKIHENFPQARIN